MKRISKASRLFYAVLAILVLSVGAYCVPDAEKVAERATQARSSVQIQPTVRSEQTDIASDVGTAFKEIGHVEAAPPDAGSIAFEAILPFILLAAFTVFACAIQANIRSTIAEQAADEERRQKSINCDLRRASFSFNHAFRRADGIRAGADLISVAQAVAIVPALVQAREIDVSDAELIEKHAPLFTIAGGELVTIRDEDARRSYLNSRTKPTEAMETTSSARA